jgi:uncharacterized membrane protein YeaQ/YmgE (transglycosylase-associated protein family)
MDIIWFLIIGLVAGWLAGQIMRGRGLGLIGNLIVGVVGSVIGGFLFGLIGRSFSSPIGSLITATIGAIVLLWIVGMVARR